MAGGDEIRMKDQEANTGGGGSGTNGATASLRIAGMFLTRLPIRAPGGELAAAVGAFPLVGLAVGAVAGGGYFLAALAGLPPLACALIALLVMALLTGALHEDGLADFADGLAGRSSDDSIRIMRDSHIGAFGVLALVFSVGLRAAALSAIADPEAAMRALTVAAVLSRASMPPVMAWVPRASVTGLAAAAGKPGRGGVLFAIASGILIAAGLIELVAIPAFAASAIAAAGVAILARRRLGGYTGDVLGAVQQAAETAVLLAIATAV